MTETSNVIIPPDLPLIVMTDLDGTLLDHFSYRADAARPALAALKQRRIPVLFNTSKTSAEVADLRHQLDNTDPYVCENGSVIHIPKTSGDGDNVEVLGTAYADILRVLHQQHQLGMRFRGFNDMPAAEVSALTGLDPEQAWLAKQRAASEPILWQGNDAEFESFHSNITAAGLRLTRGGRFNHVMGNADKATGLAFARDFYRHQWQTDVRVVALGDGENDRAMLEAADYPIVIPGESTTLTLNHPNSRTAVAKGPAGWNQCILELLQTLE